MRETRWERKLTRAGVLCRAALVLAFSSIAGISAHAQRLVFAHYMLTNQDYQPDSDSTQELKIAAYQREIRQAQAMGIDGFALNAGGWLRQPYYIRYAAQMFEAAVRLHSGFKLMFSADMCCGNTAGDVEDMMRRFASNPHYAPVYFRYRDKFVLTTFSGDRLGVAAWQKIRADLASGANPSQSVAPDALAPAAGAPDNSPMQIFLVPAFFWGGELPAPAPIQQAFEQWRSTLDGFLYWGIAGVPGSDGPLDQLPVSHRYAAVLHAAGKLYMAPVCLQFWGANANRYYEYGGGAGMRALWMDAINITHPEWVEIVTWNDFIEGTYISPIDDPNRYPGANHLDASGIPPDTLDYFHSRAPISELLAFYIQWYKTGIQPAITRDAVYYFYRTQSKDAAADAPPVEHKYGPLDDDLYITANLTASAELRVTTGGQSSVVPLPAGSTDAHVSLLAGDAPTLELLRNGRVLAKSIAPTPVEKSPQYNNYYYATGKLAAQ